MSDEHEIKTEDLFRDEEIIEDPCAAGAESDKPDDGSVSGEAAGSQADGETAGTCEDGPAEETSADGEAPGDAGAEEAAETAGAEEAAEADETAGAEEAAEEGGDGKGRLSRRAKKELAKKDEEIASLTDQYRRAMAEFDNYRKRTAKEKEQRFSMGEKSVIEKMLPVVDNFERGLAAVPENEKGSAIVSGMEMVYKQLMKQLEDLGVKPIEAVGKEFDPGFHNAVMQVESDEFETGIVAQEFQKGYTYHDMVVRHSMVGVVR